MNTCRLYLSMFIWLPASRHLCSTTCAIITPGLTFLRRFSLVSFCSRIVCVCVFSGRVVRDPSMSRLTSTVYSSVHTTHPQRNSETHTHTTTHRADTNTQHTFRKLPASKTTQRPPTNCDFAPTPETIREKHIQLLRLLHGLHNPPDATTTGGSIHSKGRTAAVSAEKTRRSSAIITVVGVGVVVADKRSLI